ncbi:hypothetical protein BHE90_003949 [Fusarium euwallaceae]|uniref:Heterokaryon incompatibility domain-containing protein n=1 Tax=Fusarium euwallaceae TaxID=1147111 RepID=A0A430M0N6_9HYPO|nr:hypothetical protein BHE90_003949 [Fusarium euwallaceae]
MVLRRSRDPVQPDQLSQPADLCDSRSTLTPAPEPSIPMENYPARKSLTRSKIVIQTVDPLNPTPAVGIHPAVDDTDVEDSNSKISRLNRLMNSQYDYANCPLPKDHLRILLLKPSEDKNSPIIVKLQSFSIAKIEQQQEAHQFTALSYHWGTDKERKKIFVDITPDSEPSVGDSSTTWKRRFKSIPVKANLHAFLQVFRQQNKEVGLWVDRVCINQADNEEKADQVSKMSTIYSMAANVVIWLGPADEDGKSDGAINFIRSLLNEDVREKLKDDKHATQWSDLLSLIRRPWFSRRWVIQEIALARRAEVRCGSERIHWLDFSHAVSIFELHFDSILKVIKGRQDLEHSLDGINDMKPLGARILVNSLSNMFQRHTNGTIHSPRQGLESLISSLSTFETSDPRDTIYTLLNLAQETFGLPSEDAARRGRRHRENGVNPPPPPFPDYSKNLLDVYTDFMKWCIQKSGSLDILFRHWALPEVKKKPNRFYPDLVELPSWVTTVHKSAYGPQQKGFGGRKTGDSFVGSPETRCYTASLDLTPVVQWGRDVPPTMSSPRHFVLSKKAKRLRSHLLPKKGARRMPRPEQTLSRLLSVKGFCIGKVSSQHPMSEGVITKGVLAALGHDTAQSKVEKVPDALWRTLVADRGPDGKAPPPWYYRACMECLVAKGNNGNLDTKRILRRKPTKIQEDYVKRVQAVCWNRTFIECDGVDRSELFGLAPFDVKRGDLVCILHGCSVPCILRQTSYGSWGDAPENRPRDSGPKEPSNFYHLIGEAFVLGQMDGEALMDLSEDDLERVSENFRLV